jgi:GTP-binding protein HflX
MATKIATSTDIIHPRTLIVGVFTPYNRMSCPEYYYQEFINLVETLGMPYDEKFFTKLRSVDNNTFLTKGKMEELRELCVKHDIEEVLFSALLSPLQERNLEDALGCRVFDREQLILNIFSKSATTSEGKIQVRIAELNYLKTRIMGKGKDFAQQAGYLGTTGPGETAKEELKRIFEEQTRQAKKQMATLSRTRDVQRKQRLTSKTPLICIIGYTNSGKSSLLNRMAKGDVLAENKLFATLDTTTRELFIDGKKKALISDTVGFISELPHSLIQAFKSTLDELQYAHLLVHVIDIGNPAWKDQIRVVQETLDELKINKPMLYVFNKQDTLTPERRENLAKELEGFDPHVVIDTLSKDGIKPLVTWLGTYKFE